MPSETPQGAITLSTHAQDLDEFGLASTIPLQALHPGPFVVLTVSDSVVHEPPDPDAHLRSFLHDQNRPDTAWGFRPCWGSCGHTGGGIHIDTEEGRGSCFQLFFPATPSSHPLPKRPRPSTLTLQWQDTAGVDDEPAILEATASILEALGLTVITATDGLDALNKFEANRESFDLVLMDLTMPRMDGHEAFQRMRSLRADVPSSCAADTVHRRFCRNSRGPIPRYSCRNPTS